MLFDFSSMAVLFLIGIGFVFVTLTIGRLVRPDNPHSEKSSVYECGEVPIGGGVRQFNMRFYLVTFVFVIFDVEIAFMYPVASVFKELLDSGWGLLALVEIAIFVLILLVGFVYAWSQGGLDWVRETAERDGGEQTA